MKSFLIQLSLLGATAAYCINVPSDLGMPQYVGTCPDKGFWLKAANGKWAGQTIARVNFSAEIGFEDKTNNAVEFQYEPDEEKKRDGTIAEYKANFKLMGQQGSAVYTYLGTPDSNTPALDCRVAREPIHEGYPYTGAVSCKINGNAAFFVTCDKTGSDPKRKELMLAPGATSDCEIVDLVAFDPCHDECGNDTGSTLSMTIQTNGNIELK